MDATAVVRSDEQRAISKYLLAHPGKGARTLARDRARLVELADGAPLRAGESLEQIEKRVARLEWAFVDEGRCEDCGRPLTDEESIARRVGPDCLEKRQGVTRRDDTVTVDPDAAF